MDCWKADFLANLSNTKSIYECYKELENESFHIIAFRLCDFKKISKIYGYGVGENILNSIGEAFYDDIPIKGISRIAGDEFVIILDGRMSQEDIETYIQDIYKKISEMDFENGFCDKITLSSGIAMNQTSNQHL